MSETVIADFVARFTVGSADNPKPVEGRIVLSHNGIAFAAPDSKRTIPISAIVDIAVGYVPEEMEAFFKDTLTLAFEHEGERSVIVIEANTDEVSKFKNLLFKARLNGATVTVKHPARIGGRVTNQKFHTGTLGIKNGGVKFREIPNSCSVELTAITHFQKDERNVSGKTHTVLTLRHEYKGQIITSEFALASNIEVKLLTRYLRSEYKALVEEAKSVDLSDEELETLFSIYTGTDPQTLSRILGSDMNYITQVLESLHQRGLIVVSGDELSATTLGRLIVTERYKRIND